MTTTLVVVRPFATYSKGDAITDPATTTQILGSEQSRKVVRVAARPPAATSPTSATLKAPPAATQPAPSSAGSVASATSAPSGSTAATTPAKGA